MAGSKTAYLSQAQLDHALGGAPYTPPADVWAVLSSAAFDPNATGAACNELTNTDYARIQISNDSSSWTAATASAPSQKSNLNDLAWTTATEDWPDDPTSIYLADAASDGNLLYGSDFSSADPVALGDTFKVLAGAFVFNED